MTAIYRPRRSPGERDLAIRGLRYHVTTWPGAESPPAVMLHGFLDTGATFQFLVDELDDRRAFAAPDWRGFGATSWAPDGYWFPDYFADLDALLDELSPGAPATLVGHSMGGNIALQYAGLRPERVRRLVCIEGFGLPRTNAAQAPERLRRWLDELREPPQYSQFESYDAFASFLVTRNPRLGPERAQFVARAWGRADADGRFVLRADPAHKRTNPVLYRREEAEAAWSDISAPVLYVVGGASEHLARLGFDGQVECVQQYVRRLEPCVIADAGHMVHHDRPAELAAAIEAFFDRT